MKTFEGNPENVLPNIIRKIKYQVDLQTTHEFRIGRTSDLSRRMKEHSFDKIIPLYYTESDDQAKFTEGVLVDYFKYHPKCVNTRRNGGSFSKEFGNYISLGIWY